MPTTQNQLNLSQLPLAGHSSESPTFSSTYHALYGSYVLPVANCEVAVWGVADYPCMPPSIVEQGRFLLSGRTQICSTGSDQSLDGPNQDAIDRWIEMARNHNRVAKLDEHKLPKIVLNTGGTA